MTGQYRPTLGEAERKAFAVAHAILTSQDTSLDPRGFAFEGAARSRRTEAIARLIVKAFGTSEDVDNFGVPRKFLQIG